MSRAQRVRGHLRCIGPLLARFAGCVSMSIEVPSSVDEFIQGEKEPASSGVVVVLGFVSMLSFLILYGILFPGRDMPVISEVLPMFEGVFDSGIWFFLLGVIFGAFSIIATIILLVRESQQ